MYIENYNNYDNIYPIEYVDDYVSNKGQHKKRIKCACVHCGQILIKRLDRAKIMKSCGCKNAGRFQNNNTIGIKHGDSHTRLYSIYIDMKERCNSVNCINYKYYGARGIKVCDEWNNNYLNFKNWALNNGYNDNLTIDRKNVNGNYCPENCRWATIEEQQNNKRSNVYLNIADEILTLKQMCKKYDVNYNIAKNKINKHTKNKEDIFMELIS